MLRWQHKNGRNRIFWGQLCAVSGLAHAVVVVCILFVYSDRASHYTFTMHETVPTIPTVVVLAPPHKGSRVSGNAAYAPVSSVQPSTRIMVPVPQKKQEAKTRKAVKKKVAKKPIATKQVQKKIPQKAHTKPKVDSAKKVQEAPKASEKKETPHIPAVAESSVTNAPAQEGQADSIMISYADARTAHQYTILQHEFSKHWAPPPGVADECTCRLTVCVDRAGMVNDVVVEESSGVLIFDIAARTAVLAVEWPAWARGTSITITFKP